jgi:hypothetical protein
MALLRSFFAGGCLPFDNAKDRNHGNERFFALVFRLSL